MKTNRRLQKALCTVALGAALPFGAAAQTFTTHDVGGSSVESQPRWFTEVNGKAYFSARTPNSDIELHSYDMATGSVTVIDLTPGVDQWGFALNSNIREIVEAGGNLYFQANVDNDTELYKYNTSSGVFTKIDMNPTSSSMPTDLFAASNGMIYCRARQYTPQGNNQELFEYNTNTGQFQMYELYPGLNQYGMPNSSYPTVQCEYQGKLYMNAEGSVGKELYSFDINTKQHNLVWDIATGLTSSGNQYSGSPKEMTIFNGKIYGAAYRPSEDNELIIYDPSTGDKEFRVIDPGQTIFQGTWVPAGSLPQFFTELNGDLYFFAAHTTTGYELFKLDGQTDQISLAFDTWPGTYTFCQGICMTQGNLGDPSNFVVRDGLLYYTAASATRNYELWVHDPATGNSTMVHDYWPGISSLGDDNAGYPKWTTLLSNGDLITQASKAGYENEMVVVSWCPQAASIPAPASVNAYGLYAGQIIQWGAVSHPDLVGYNVTSDNGTTSTTNFVTGTQWIEYAIPGPGTYTYTVKAVIDNGSCGQLEAETGTSTTLTYSAIEPQCQFFYGPTEYKLEFHWNTNYWFTNIFSWNGSAWQYLGAAPLALDHLNWCTLFGGGPVTKAAKLGASENGNGFEGLLNELQEVAVAVYPNPSVESTSITYSIANDSDVQIELVDISGRVIAHVVNANQTAGNYKFDLDLSNNNIGTGIYFVKASINGKIQVKKLIVE